MAKVTLVYQAPGDDQPQELPVVLSDKGKLHMPSVCRMLGLSLIQLDGVLVPQDATYSPPTYDPDARIEVSGFQLAAGTADSSLQQVLAIAEEQREKLEEQRERLEEQRERLEAMDRKISVLEFTSAVTDKVLVYDDDNATHHDGTNAEFKQELQEAHGYVMSSSGVLLTCMLSGEQLPSCLVVAGHIVKQGWEKLGIHAHLGMDVDDVGNGLLLFKPFQWAFDNSKLCFIYDQETDQFVMHILDPALRERPVLEMFDHPQRFSPLVQEYVARIPQEHLATARDMFQDKTFQDFEARWLAFPPLSPRPYKRALCFHAHRVRRYALQHHWFKEHEWNFEPFWAEGHTSRINAWLEMQVQQQQEQQLGE